MEEAAAKPRSTRTDAAKMAAKEAGSAEEQKPD